MKTDPNEKVDPGAWHPEMGWSPSEHVSIGLTKREYFAAMALQGFLGSSLFMEGVAHAAVKTLQDVENIVAKMAVDQANSLIAELNKEQK